jgi:hypothetical protein
MDPDLVLVIGIVIGILTIPSLLSAYSSSNPPRAGAIMALIAGVLIIAAMQTKPSGYEISELPDVFTRVINRYLN